MKKLTRLLALSFFLLFTTNLMAQDAEMADEMRANGKIYVLVAIILVIFAGLIAFLVLTDRKVSKLEKRLEK
ncbi:MAG: CcmD family protein [Bacteroidetes bacterium]|nr:CcmD family protein [Bacteroidota bacterium]